MVYKTKIKKIEIIEKESTVIDLTLEGDENNKIFFASGGKQAVVATHNCNYP
jgi:intein/homing endonuclease